jgi:hypothetical protein
MSEYQNLLAKYKSESIHPYNDGWSQQFYKEEYEKLLKMGEKKYDKQQLKEKIKNLEKNIEFLNTNLQKLKQDLKKL